MADLQLSGVAPVGGAGSAVAPVAPAAPATEFNAAATPVAVPPAGAAVPLGANPAAMPAAPESAIKTPASPGRDEQVREAAKEAVKRANAAMAVSGTLLVFVFDDQAHHMAVKVLDVQTQKVVQQIPLQHMPATASALAGEAHSGGLVDTTA